jgi:hypothetical protein
MVRLLWTALIIAVLAWLTYSASELGSVQDCVASKKSQETVRWLEVSARIRTQCLGVFLYDNREAVTAIATTVIAIFTLTLWWSTWGLLRHGRVVERAYMSAGPVARQISESGGVVFQIGLNNYGKTPGFCDYIFADIVAIDPKAVALIRQDEKTWKATMNANKDQLRAAPEYKYESEWRKR